MKKKLIAAMLSVLMCLCLFTACTAQSKAPLTEEEKSLTPEGETDTEAETDPEDTEEAADKSGNEEEGMEEAEGYEEGGPSSQEEEYYETSTGLDMEYVAQILIDIQAEKGNEKPSLSRIEDQAVIDQYYPGLSEMNLLQQVCFMSPEEGAPCEIMLVECRSASAASRALEIFQKRINKGKEDGWKNAQTFSSNNLAGMVCLPEGSYIPDDIFILD